VMTSVHANGDAPVPRYGDGSLAEVVPSILAGLGTAGFEDVLGVGELSSAVILLVDGLGWEPIHRGAAEAPFLSELARDGRPVTTGFPSTTVTSLTSIGTGLPPGRHGLVGYTMALSGYERSMNVLRWSLSGGGPSVDLRDEVVPEELQPHPTTFERAAAHGVRVSVLGHPDHARSGMTRAALRGGDYLGVYSTGDLAAVAAEALWGDEPSLVYAYHPYLDVTGHLRGAASESWALELGHVDRLVADIAARLPPGGALVVTGDHGMVDVREDQKLDVADEPGLLEGVRLLAGEPRARYVYARPGAEADVLAAWRQLVGDRMWVASRDEAISAGWFGPGVSDLVRPRIGDVVAAAVVPFGVVRRGQEGFMATFTGHHGSLTPAEQLVPLLIVRP
jgi:hypothetical protein